MRRPGGERSPVAAWTGIAAWEAIEEELKGEVSLDRLLAMGDELRDIRAGTLEDRVLFARLAAGDRAIAAEQQGARCEIRHVHPASGDNPGSPEGGPRGKVKGA